MNSDKKRTFALALHMPTLLETMRHHDLTAMVSKIIADKFQVYLCQWEYEISMSFLDQYVSIYVECTKFKALPPAEPDWNYVCDPFPALDNYMELTDLPIEQNDAGDL